jgi:ATP-dependent RNA helicase DDX56/DBP9
MALKRKLNERDVPEPESPQSPKRRASDASETEPTTAAKKPTTPAKETVASFTDLELEPRLLRGIRDQRWSTPTAVQSKAIPLAMQGRDILARSGTGTGKTGAYLLPILHNILRRKGKTSLILVPTKELALQISKVAKALSAHCGQEVRVQNIAGKESEVVTKAKLADKPEIVIATPARASANINNGALAVDELAHLVVDEGDLVLGYGFKEDLDQIAQNIPKGVQMFLMSATLNTEVESLGSLLCNDPVTLKLDDLDKDAKRVKQYAIKCAEEEKFLLIYAMFKLGLIKGKTIVFVGDTDRSYRVKLFLEQFGVKACVLNSELPLASRLHIVEEFNKNVYNILIASDETEILGTQQKKSGESRPKKKSKTDKEGKNDSGVSRGIDFLNISCVLQFDFAANWKSYFHRIGRTARAGKSGTAISFIIPKDKYRKHKSTTFPACEHDEEVLAKVEAHQEAGQKIEDYKFDMKRLEPFRYRFGDALRSVTRIAIREARVKELRLELSKSEKLARYVRSHYTNSYSTR